MAILHIDGTYEMLSVEYSSSRLRSCDPVSSSPSSRLSDTQDTALMGGCGLVGVSGVRMADLLGELVSLLFNFPKKYKGERERERERES